MRAARLGGGRFDGAEPRVPSPRCSRGYRCPSALRPAVVAQQAGATAMIDCSDGLLADLAHLARASRVADVETSAPRRGRAAAAVAAAVGGGDPLTFILSGGDDHALLATFAEDSVPDGWRVIGRVLPGEPAVTVDGACGNRTPGGDTSSGRACRRVAWTPVERVETARGYHHRQAGVVGINHRGPPPDLIRGRCRP